jgi:hypothetical protein
VESTDLETGEGGGYALVRALPLFLASLLAELAEKRDVVPKHGVVGARIGKRVGGLVRDAFFGESGELAKTLVAILIVRI